MPYKCKNRIVFPAEMLWIPDVVISNSIQRFLPMQRDREGVTLWSDGLVTHQFSGEITVQCAMDLSLFPFDRQTCSMHLESWLLTTLEERFVRPNKKPSSFVKNVTENEEWTIKNVHFEVFNGNFIAKAGTNFARVRFFYIIFINCK